MLVVVLVLVLEWGISLFSLREARVEVGGFVCCTQQHCRSGKGRFSFAFVHRTEDSAYAGCLPTQYLKIWKWQSREERRREEGKQMDPVK